jgi:hypothetical protein
MGLVIIRFVSGLGYNDVVSLDSNSSGTTKNREGSCWNT